MTGHAHVGEHDLGRVTRRIPIFLNFWPIVSPGVPGGTMNDAWPRLFSSGSTAATTTCVHGTCVIPPLVIHVLVPLITHSSLASS